MYCQTLGLKESICTSNGKAVKGIDGWNKSIGIALMQVPFKQLGVTIDVKFIYLEGEVPSLMALRYLYSNWLDISIQRCKVICG